MRVLQLSSIYSNSVLFVLRQAYLDPSSRPPLADLAGMTNCAPVYWGKGDV